MPTQIDICNQALDYLGDRSGISSLTEGSSEANACNRHWGACLDDLLAQHPWTFARAQTGVMAPLGAIAGTPENPDGSGRLPQGQWRYEYTLPSDCIQVRDILQSCGAAPFVPFEITGAKDSGGNDIVTILTNQPQAQLVYTKRANPAVFSQPFATALAWTLAYVMCLTLTGDRERWAVMEQQAAKAIADAWSRDLSQEAQTIEAVPSWLAVRGYAPPADIALGAISNMIARTDN